MRSRFWSRSRRLWAPRALSLPARRSQKHLVSPWRWLTSPTKTLNLCDLRSSRTQSGGQARIAERIGSTNDHSALWVRSQLDQLMVPCLLPGPLTDIAEAALLATDGSGIRIVRASRCRI